MIFMQAVMMLLLLSLSLASVLFRKICQVLDSSLEQHKSILVLLLKNPPNIHELISFTQKMFMVDFCYQLDI